MSEELKYYELMNYAESKAVIKSNINQLAGNFVAIGYYLKHIRDKEMYKEDGYQSIWELAQVEFGISKSQASKFMSINDRFSVDGNSPILQERYREFSSSKLSEMLYLTDEQLEQVTVGTTVAQIREIKKPDKVVSTSKQEPEPKKPYYECAAYKQYWYTKGCKDCFYDNADCPYDRTGYFEELKQKEEWNKRCEVLKEMCNALCEMFAHSLETNKYSMESIKSISRKDQEYSFGFGDDGYGHSKYDAICKNARYYVKTFDGKEAWQFEAGAIDQHIWNFNSREWDKRQRNIIDIPEPVDDQPKFVYNEPEFEEVVDESVIKTDDSVIETVEADIIQTVPEQNTATDGQEDELSIAKEILQKKQTDLKNWIDVTKGKETTGDIRAINRLKIEVAALANLICELEAIEKTTPKMKQPELPVLKNNDQRRAFIEAYESWPIWIDIKETGERYYRYDLADKVAIIVKVSKQHALRDYKPTKKVEYASPVYYLLGVRANYSTKVEFVEDDTRTFYECCSNMTMLIDYLREYQKKK